MKKIISLLFVCAFALNLVAQEKQDTTKPEGYKFTIEKQVKTTSVKNQYRSGTCWSFGGMSFIETEMIRLGKDSVDLSEMFNVYHVYSDRAVKNVRLHGKFNFGGGAEISDPIDVIAKYGMVPESAYSGINYGEDNHVHGEMDEVLKDYIAGVIKNKNKKLTPVWHKGFDAILDAYLGKIPEKFTYKGKEYTPKTFAEKVVGINPEDYIYITSFTHHPFYKPFIFDVPDNWAYKEFYNLPLDEMEQVIDNAINNGFSVGWSSDVSEKGFSFKDGLAIVPEKDIANMSDSERSKWEKLSKREKEAQLYKFEKPGKEKVITQKMRQEAFDNYETTDDHVMHITGIAKDQNGTKYYYVKNSWGTTYNDYKGYFYASEAYVRYKTTSIAVHKDALPKSIAKKLGIK
ncbi:MAG: aminopeptidase [Bacteroidetes bacterium]|nr:MAG: aminopeptidase [Bacteroidota bacterium]